MSDSFGPWEKEYRSLRLSALVSSAAPPAWVHTTMGRELAFVLGHTIHHSSLIAVMLKLLGVEVPQHFGYAPPTITHSGKDLWYSLLTLVRSGTSAYDSATGSLGGQPTDDIFME